MGKLFVFFDRGKHIKAVKFGKHDVKDDEIRMDFGGFIQSCLTINATGDLVAVFS